MAINKKLIHFLTKANFDNLLASGNILDTSICFIKDANLIWTHGNFYDGSAVDLSNIEASILNILNNKQDNISDLDSIRSGALKGATSAQQFYNQTTLSKEGWYRIGLLTAVRSTSSARIVVGGTNADVSPIIMDFQHNFRGDMISQMPTVMTPLYVTKVRAVKKTSDDVYVDLYFTNISSSLTTVSVFPLEGEWESMNFVDVTTSAGGTVATQIDIVQDGFLDWKVDKVEGKGLSTEDFTTALKTKLEGLNNYDDTTIEAAVSKLREDFDALVSGDTTTAIKSFNDIVAFLDGISDSEDLDSIIASIEQQIAAKQDKLVSGTNIKTINGESILGNGNVIVQTEANVKAVDPLELLDAAETNPYIKYTEQPLTETLKVLARENIGLISPNDINFDDYYTKSEVNDYVDEHLGNINAILESIIDGEVYTYNDEK